MPELLAPAGNFEKLRAAILYGADAVYLSGKAFGMRAAADNFTIDELRAAITYAHERGVRVYLTVNVMPHDGEYAALRAYFDELHPLPPDALIVADLGVLALAKERLPQVPLHVSTQANAVSAAACRAYHALGAERVVLARELTLEEIRRIREDTPRTLALEAFIHGSMCISYSGRCLLSNFFTGRDANRGMCTQSCRWHYTLRERSFELVEEKRPDLPIPIEEIDGETFLMSSRDICMIEHVPALIEAGIDSFKIEGRIKSAYYTATVTNAYRMAIDAHLSGKAYDPAWMRELACVSHRPYHTGYYFDRPGACANVTDNPGYVREKAYLATVLSYDEETKLATLRQRNKLSLGDHVACLSPGQTGRPLRVEALYNEAGEPIEAAAHPQMCFRMPIPFPVREGDILRAGEEGDCV